MSQYVGAVDVHGSPFAGTTYTSVPVGPMSFSITSDDDGKFKSLAVQSGLSIFQKNLIKGWAAQLQINAGEIKRGSKAFVSTEVRHFFQVLPKSPLCHFTYIQNCNIHEREALKIFFCA
jgi:hypothetical protein